MLLVLVVQTYRKTKEVPYMEMSRDNDQKREENLYMEVLRDIGAYKSSDLQLSNPCSTFILRNQLAFFS